VIGIFVYALGWLTFAVAHSFLARLNTQRKLEPHFKGGYRLLYNGLSVVHLLAVFAIGRTFLDTRAFEVFSSVAVDSLLTAVKAVGFIILVLALMKYDLGRFSGLTQVRVLEYMSTVSPEPLQRSGLNRWVRHPLYTGAFLVLWGGADSSLGFWTAVWGSLYLVIGTVLEERKLVQFYGDAYRAYQAEIPMYFPTRRSLVR